MPKGAVCIESIGRNVWRNLNYAELCCNGEDIAVIIIGCKYRPVNEKNYDKAFQKASAIDAVRNAPNKDIALAQMQVYKGFSKLETSLPLSLLQRLVKKNIDRSGMRFQRAVKSIRQ